MPRDNLVRPLMLDGMDRAFGTGLAALVAPGASVLWVASSGGHLAELHSLATRSQASDRSFWLTFDTPQSRDLLDGDRKRFVRYVGPRDTVGAIRTASVVPGLLRRGRFDVCISTGAAIATSVLPVAAALGVRSLYVESLARVHSPSLSGRILSLVPGVCTYTQYPGWVSPRWRFTGSLLDGWSTGTERLRPSGPLKVFVSLGTMRRYRFDRAVDAVLKVLDPRDDVRWQVGASIRDGLPGDSYAEMGYEEIIKSIEWADVVLCHGGVGTILDCLARGKSPLMLTRSAAFGEHVDDHQAEFVHQITSRGLGAELDLTNPSRADLDRAAASRVRVG